MNESIIDLGAVSEGRSARIARRRALHRSAPAHYQRAEVASAASFAQERLWILEKMGSGSGAYNLAAAWRLEGELDVEAIEATVNEIRRRNEVLRSSFLAEGADLTLVTAPFSFLALPLHRIDRITSTEEREEQLQAEMMALIRTKMDLDKGPLIQWHLFRLRRREHVLLQIAHHSVFDGGSFAPLLREFGTLYRAFRAGVAPPPSPVSMRFSDFAQMERERSGGPESMAAREFWRQQMEGPVPELGLPTDRVSPPTLSFRGACVSTVLPQRITAQVGGLAVSLGSTPGTVFLAILRGLMHRHADATDMIVGVPTSLRDRRELREAIGCFTNTLPLRLHTGGDPSFRELIERVAGVCAAAYRFREVPFPHLVRKSSPVRIHGHDPLFRVLFSSLELPEPPELPGLDVTWMEMERGSSFADLELEVVRTPRAEILNLHYATDLFEEGTARKILEQYRTMLEAALEDPDRRLSGLSPLGDSGSGLQVGERGGREAGQRSVETVHRFVAEGALLWPDGIAVQGGGEQLTRREIEAGAERMKERLRAMGVGRGARVGILLPRRPEMVVSLLGVLKAGGAYVPLDAESPPSRLGYMMEDAGVTAVLTTRELEGRLPVEAAARRMFVDEDEDEWGEEELEELIEEDIEDEDEEDDDDELDLADEDDVEWDDEEEAGPEDAAYVIYTSGSTGRPKGVEVPHRAVVNFLRSVAREPGLGPEDRLLAVTTLSFDISILELFLPLVTGGTVVMADRESARDGRRLKALLAEEGITAMQATPATWRLLVDAGWRSEGGFKILSGGEALTPNLARELLERGGELWNLYGPTEATVWCTLERVREVDGVVPIGRPLENVSVYVLDDEGAPVPVGVKGELWIGGIQVARGYVGRPDLTAERFLEDPFSEAGGRMYRTGDVARWREDGRLECLGRKDHQVKINGYRVELGEVEGVLEELEEVREGVVELRQDASGEPRLVAWVSYRSGQELLGSEVRERLRERLPRFMVPSLVVEVARVPRMLNGKVDRSALPDPLQAGGGSAEGAPEPPTPTQRVLAEIWSEVLGIDRIGPRDNFFDLGGHSLLAMRTLTRMEECTGCRFEPRDMMVGTLEHLAALADSSSGRGQERAPS